MIRDLSDLLYGSWGFLRQQLNYANARLKECTEAEEEAVLAVRNHEPTKYSLKYLRWCREDVEAWTWHRQYAEDKIAAKREYNREVRATKPKKSPKPKKKSPNGKANKQKAD